jgi:hypothetical protein
VTSKKIPTATKTKTAAVGKTSPGKTVPAKTKAGAKVPTKKG